MESIVDVRDRMNETHSLRADTWERLDRGRTVDSLRKHLKVGSSYGYRLFGAYILETQSNVTLCLDDGIDATFIVSELERGGLHRISIHASINTAFNDFFARMNGSIYPMNIIIMND